MGGTSGYVTSGYGASAVSRGPAAAGGLVRVPVPAVLLGQGCTVLGFLAIKYFFSPYYNASSHSDSFSNLIIGNC